MPTYRAIYWPGSAGCFVPKHATCTHHEKVLTFEAKDLHEARNISAAKLAGTSDGCKLEVIDNAGNFAPIPATIELKTYELELYGSHDRFGAIANPVELDHIPDYVDGYAVADGRDFEAYHIRCGYTKDGDKEMRIPLMTNDGRCVVLLIKGAHPMMGHPKSGCCNS